MSDKKGSRDISELKQRLGLKKAGGGAAQPAARSNGGVVPPPGMNLPPPPGVTPPQPTGPIIPNAADDPFGAMNAMAAVGTVQRAPEIIIVNDGKPVENVGGQGTGAKVARIAIPAVIAIGLGLGIGRISKDANFYNDGLKDAKLVLGDAKSPAPYSVIATKKQIAELDGLLDQFKSKGFKPDAELNGKLSALASKIEVNADKVFLAKQNALDGVTSVMILQFYAGVAEIKGMLDVHVKASTGDDALIKLGKDLETSRMIKDTEVKPMAGRSRYMVLVSAPSSKDSASAADKNAEFGAKIVEVGGLYCGGDTKDAKADCAGAPITGFAYRTALDGLFSQADIQLDGAESVPTKKLLPLISTGVRDALFKGNEAGAAEYFYIKRLTEIQKRAKKLLDDGNKLETKLQTEANKSSRFSFFL